MRLLEQPRAPRLRRGASTAASTCTATATSSCLHTDAEVANDWLDRLARTRGARDIGVVAPFTNSVGIATYPLPRLRIRCPRARRSRRSTRCSRAPTPAAASRCRSSTGRACISAASACAPSAPRRRPLGSDYGVEIDFCLRAGSAGFRHLLAGDVFVGHEGHASFGAPRRGELAERSATGARRSSIPHYPRAAQASSRERDPARPFARRVDLLRLAESPASHPRVRLASVGRRHPALHERSRRARRGALRGALPRAGRRRHGEAVWPRAGEEFAAVLHAARRPADARRTLRTLGVARLHFHHVHLLPRAILELPAAVGVPYDCTLHDYYRSARNTTSSPRTAAIAASPTPRAAPRASPRGPANGAWTSRRGAARSRASCAAPTRDRAVAATSPRASRRYFPELAIEVWPHPEAQPAPVPRIVRVVMLGNLSPEKGLRVVAACARRRARARRCRSTFRVLGSTTEPMPQSPDAPLTIYGQYVDSELAATASRAEKPDVMLFAGAGSGDVRVHAVGRAGLRTADRRVGARRASRAARGHPRALDRAVERAAGRMERRADRGRRRRALARQRRRGASARGELIVMDPSRYLALYLAPLPPAPRRAHERSRALPALDDQHFYLRTARSRRPDLSLPQLYVAGVECGHTRGARRAASTTSASVAAAAGGVPRAAATARRAIAQQLADELLATQRPVPMRRDAGPGRRDAGAQSASCRYHHGASRDGARRRAAAHRRARASRAWRMTAPLRDAGHRAKVALARSSARRASGVRRLPQLARASPVDPPQRGPGRARAARAREGGPRRALPAGGRRSAVRAAGGARARSRFRPCDERAARVDHRPGLRQAAADVHLPEERAREHAARAATRSSCRRRLARARGRRASRGDRRALRAQRRRTWASSAPATAAAEARARRDPRVPQQRHDRDAGLARRAARACSTTTPTPASSAPSSSIPTAACRKPAASCGATARRGTTAATTIPTSPSTTTCARPTIAPARASRCPPRCSASSAASTRATRPPTTRTPTSRSPCARRGRKVFYQPRATVVHFEGQTSGHRRDRRRQAPPGGQPGDVRREVGDRARRRTGRTASQPELERDRWAQRRVLVIDACMLTPDQDSGSVRMQAMLEILTDAALQGDVRRRQPRVPRSRTSSQLQQRGIEVLFHPYVRSIADLLATRGREFDVIVICRATTSPSSTSTRCARSRRRRSSCSTPSTCTSCARSGWRSSRATRSARRRPRAKRDEELALIRKADVTLVVSHGRADAAAASSLPDARVMVLSQHPRAASRAASPSPSARASCSSAASSIRPTPTRCCGTRRRSCRTCASGCPASRRTSSAARCRATITALAADDFVVAGYVPDVDAVLHRLPRLDLAAALRRRRQGQGQPGDELRPAGRRDDAVGRRHAPAPGEDVLVADDAAAFADAIVRALQRRGAVAAARRGRASRTSAAISRATSRAARSRASSRSPRQRRPRRLTPLKPCLRLGRFDAAAIVHVGGTSGPTPRGRASSRAPRTW